MKALALVAAAAVALSGCAGAPPRSPQGPELVGYIASVSRMAAADQKRELARAAAAWAQDPTPYVRVKLGGLFAQPAPALRDDARALALLEPMVGAPGQEAGADPALADLAALLHTQVAERQRLARSDARKQEALRERSDVLQERIEAMKAIDRSILQREERQRAK